MDAAREKSRVAVTSVAAAAVLTIAKIAAGVSTGSLGILSEAAHSALDLMAAGMTVLAVRASAKPADEHHPYGHGKFESISALFETLLLLATCLWIIHEAIQRLFFRSLPVHSSVLGFLVILGSIAVDFGRSRALLRVARKHHSRALEADALHFSTDVWSSAVVVLGLALVWLSERLAAPWLAKADAVAALGVAGIVLWVSVRLGRKTVDDLLDAVPLGRANEVREAVMAVQGVEAVMRVRLRHTGGDWFSDITIQVAASMSTEDAHQVANEVEGTLKGVLGEGDCVVHIEPYGSIGSLRK